ncbi:MAG: lysine--tRNA ligase [Tenericutes bacterium]|jgi:lysyl-tRNA synthetase class 2|nr:lysine--tRNA ligase [Mycoplasmatota bacterium]
MKEFSDQEQVRRNKISNIKRNCNPYPDRYEINYNLKEIKDLNDGVNNVKVAGRIVLMRKMGKISFLTIRDIEGSAQISIKIDLVGEKQYEFFKDNFDLGDFIGVEGEIFTTHTGEKTIRANTFVFLGKALKPLPEKFHGLNDPELCYRQRYLDLIMNQDTRDTFLTRIKFIKEIRNYLDNLGYLEIETPILNNKPSGAIAKPFKSYHNALDMEVYLRIAPETYMKRAVIAGMPKVFEIARCFRNEGIDATHLQDFTMIEAYQSYYNYQDNMKLIQDMLQAIIKKMYGTLNIKIGDKEIDLSGNWPSNSFRDLIIKYADIDIAQYNTKELLLKKIQENNIDLESSTPIENLGYGNLVDYLYKKVARPNIVGPIYLVNHPISLSPLARANDEKPEITDRFQLIINGAEIVNGFSELVDPQEQERRLLEQSKLKAAGDDEAMDMDYDYITAMEYGMPPISGWGMGIDRLIQLLTNSNNIKDVVLFPLMRQTINEEIKK